MAFTADVSKINETALEQFSRNNNENDNDNLISEQAENLPAKGIRERDLKELEVFLSKELTPVQAKLAANIFRSFCEHATAKEKEGALASFVF